MLDRETCSESEVARLLGICRSAHGSWQPGWDDEPVGADDAEQDVIGEVVAALRGHGACFAYLHGSRARGDHRAGSDTDVAAWWSQHAPPSFDVLLPAGVDLLVLNGAPLLMAGRVAAHGILLFDDDPAARVRWEATTRKVYFDELPRMERADRDFAEAVRRGR